ncbi:putative disease resistance protein RGA4 [Quercus lobata]|nr:putative disease resistance protein RGA4 [Quercus lobata]
MDRLWRSLFQEVREDRMGNITLKMHGLIHDLTQSVSRIDCTLVNSNATNINEEVRHLSFPFYNASFFEKNLSPLVKAKKIRTLILTSNHQFYNKKGEEESTLKKLITSFKCLRVLDLHGLRITTTPNCIDKLTHLKYLDLSKNDIEVLPNSIIRLLNLQTLKLSGCRKLKELPRDVQKLVNLKHLNIYCCDSLTHMPCGLGQLTSLQMLPLFVVSKDPAAFSSKHSGGLVELKKLNNVRGELCVKNLEGVNAVEAKAANLKDKQNLRNLKLSWNWEGNDGVDVCNEENLLEGLQPHHALKLLHVEGYMGVRFSSWLPSLTSLVNLKFWKSKVQHLSPLYQLPSLRYLDLRSMMDLEYISDREITNEVSDLLASSSTTFFPSLESLQLLDCPNLKGWWRTDIVKVNFDNDHNKVAITTSTSSHQNLPSFPCLSYFHISNCSNLTCMPLFPSLEDKLVLSNASLKPLQQTMTTTMNMTGASLLPSSPPLSKLKYFSLVRMQDMESLPEEWLQNLTSLEYLKIWACPRLKSLSRFTHLTSLKRLEIWECEEVDLFGNESGNGTQCVTTLQVIKISNVPHLITLPEWIGNFTSLQRLKINECPNLTSLHERINKLTSLQNIEIFRCPNLKSLPKGISDLTSLQRLEINECPNLTSLPEGMHRLTSLQSLRINNCPHLKERCQERIGEDWPKIAHIPFFRYYG